MPEGIAVEARTAEARISAPRESIGQRYAATLAAQLVQLAASVAGAGIVPRALGAAAFGNYNFLLNMAGTVRGFTEPSVQQAFFTFSAQEERTGRLTRLYGLWVLLQLAVILLLVATAAATGLTGRIWPGQRPNDILLITLVDWAGFLVISLKQLGDAKGLTVRPQLIGAVSAVTVLVGIVALAVTGRLTFFSYAMLSIVAAAVTAGSLVYWLLVRHRDQCWSGSVRGSVRQSLGRWWAYSRPLILVEYYTTFLAVSEYLLHSVLVRIGRTGPAGAGDPLVRRSAHLHQFGRDDPVAGGRLRGSAARSRRRGSAVSTIQPAAGVRVTGALNLAGVREPNARECFCRHRVRRRDSRASSGRVLPVGADHRSIEHRGLEGDRPNHPVQELGAPPIFA